MRSGWIVLILLVTACSSSVPLEIRQALPDAPGVEQLREQPASYVAQQVRWGGKILQTDNRQDASRVTVIAFPLSGKGEPQTSAASTGRFIAIVDGFLEPLVYGSDRLITVRGRFLETESRQIGEYPYLYPLIKVDHYYLWPIKQPPRYYDYPPYWGYDPWYYPGRYPHRGLIP